MSGSTTSIDERRIQLSEVTLNVATAGSGPAVLLVHGWPHTWQVWSRIIPTLADDYRVIAVDLRGAGGSDRAIAGYDAATLAGDLAGVLETLGIASASIIAIDAAVPAAFLLAHERPELVDRLVLMEGTLGLLPGAEEFFASGPPWWFGFHAVPGLAETVLEGHEAQYIDFFLGLGVSNAAAIDPEIRGAIVEGYTGRESLRCGFELYRAAPVNARLLSAAAEGSPLAMPVLAIGARTVGDALARQLQPLSDDLTARLIESSAHIVPLDRPEELLGVITPFLA